MIDEKILLGYPIDFQDICQIYPPTVNDVIGNKDFGIYQSLFTMTQEELDKAFLQDERVTKVPTPFQYLLIVLFSNKYLTVKKTAIQFTKTKTVFAFCELLSNFMKS